MFQRSCPFAGALGVEPWLNRLAVDPHSSEIVCLEDGKQFKSLKRHLRKFDMTADQYREKWGLPRDYPMVAPNYDSRRSELAKAMGLGQARKGKPSKKKAAV